MKTYLTLLIVVCQSAVALAQDNDGKKPYLTKSLAGDAISKVMVTTSAGGIKVSGRPGEAARIEVYIRGNNDHELSKEEIEKRLREDYDMNISVNGHELSAVVKNRHNFSNWKNQMSISFKIYVPEHVSTDLHTSGGGIDLDNLNGNEHFSTSGGGLELEKLHGTIYGRTSGGGIDVSDSGDDLDLSTSGGGIDAKNCDGKIRLVTSGGGLDLKHLKGNIYAHTSGGSVEGDHIEGELVTGTSGGGINLKDMACSLEASTSGGDLYADMRQVGKYLKLHASGNIDLKLPSKQGFDLNLAASDINDHILSGFKGEWHRGHVNGNVNGGGIPVEAHASGDMEVRYN